MLLATWEVDSLCLVAMAIAYRMHMKTSSGTSTASVVDIQPEPIRVGVCLILVDFALCNACVHARLRRFGSATIYMHGLVSAAL